MGAHVVPAAPQYKTVGTLYAAVLAPSTALCPTRQALTAGTTKC